MTSRIYAKSIVGSVRYVEVTGMGVWIGWQGLWTLHGRAHLERRRAQGGGVNWLAGAMDTPLTSPFGKAMWTVWGCDWLARAFVYPPHWPTGNVPYTLAGVRMCWQ